MSYLLAALAIMVGDSANATRYINDVMTSRGTSERVKEKARDLREILKNGNK